MKEVLKTIKNWWKVFLVKLILIEFLILIFGGISNVRLQLIPLVCLILLFGFIKLIAEPDLKK